MFRKFLKNCMDLLSFTSSFKCCKNFPLKINFSESIFLDVYAVVHNINFVIVVTKHGHYINLLREVRGKIGTKLKIT